MFKTELDCIRPLSGTLPAARGRSAALCPRQVVGLLNTSTGCQQAEAVCLTLAVASNNHVSLSEKSRITGKLPFPRARIFWGAGGAERAQVDVDIRSGTTVSVVTESIEVRLSYLVVLPPWTQEDPCDDACMPVLHVSGFLGYGGCTRATLTEVAYVETPGQSTLIPIPPFAESFTVLPQASSSVSAHIRFLGSIYDIEDVIVNPLSNQDQFNGVDQIPIPNGAMWIEIENTDNEPVSAFVVFRIST